MQPNPQTPADLVTFTEGIFNENIHFCAVLPLEKRGLSTTYTWNIYVLAIDLSCCYLNKLIPWNSWTGWSGRYFMIK